MAPPPEYDKEPKAPDKSATNISTEDSHLINNLVNDQHNTSDHKSTNTVTAIEVENKKHIETLDDGQLKALLDEAINYKNPKDREGKSDIFKELLEKAEQESDEQACSAAARTLSGCRSSRRGRRGPPLPHSNSLQDLVAAAAELVAAEPPRHKHHHPRHHPPPQNVSARAIHGGSLPSGVDTSSLSEEPARGAGYLATVRCVNPPPLAERRVSASDANAPEEMELLNRRSKPMFPMTYTARATLEIGSGAVCSGRAVTTTTASNQVRTTTSATTPATNIACQVPASDPQVKLMNALCPRSDTDEGGWEKTLGTQMCIKENVTESASISDLKGKTNKPRGPKEPISNGNKEKEPDNNSVKRKDYLQKCPQSWVENVNNWYKSLSVHYPEPLNGNIKSCKQNIANEETMIQTLGTSQNNFADTKSTILSTQGVLTEEQDMNGIKNKFGIQKSLPNSVELMNDSICEESPDLRHVIDKDSKELLHTENKTICKQKVSKRHKKRTHDLVVPTLCDPNPRNIRPMSIGWPPSATQVYNTVKLAEPSHNISEEANKPVDINSNTVNIELKDIKEHLDKANAFDGAHNEPVSEFSSGCCHTSKKREQLKQLTDMFNKLTNYASCNIELRELKSNQQREDRNDAFSKYVILQEKVLLEIESLQEEIMNDERMENATHHAMIGDDQGNFQNPPNIEHKPYVQSNIQSVESSDIVSLNSISEETNEGAVQPYRAEEQPKKSDGDISTELSNNAYVLLTLPSPNNTEYFISESTPKPKTSKRKENLSLSPSYTNKKEEVINKNILKVLLFENLFKNASTEKSATPEVSAITNDEVDSTISFSCITTPEVVDSCNTTSSTSPSAVAVDPKPRSVISSSFNGLPLSRPNYGSTGTSGSDDYKKSLDENGNSVQGFSSPLSGSSQHKKPRRKKVTSVKNETVIDCRQIDGYRGDKDVNELLRFIESNADNGRGAKLSRVKHKDDFDDKTGKKRSAERRKDKENKIKRASSLEELSLTKIEDLTDVPETSLRCDKKDRRDHAPAKQERRSWGDDAREPLEGAPIELTDFQTVTKKRRPRRRADDAERDPPRRRAPAPPSDRSNDSNDDLDSVHSLPDAPRAAPPPAATPLVSYAEIARTRHNIPDLIESCNFYADGEGAPRRDPAPAGDADGYPALDPRAPLPRRRDIKPAIGAVRRDRKDRTTAPAENCHVAECPAPDVVGVGRPAVILLDSAVRGVSDMDGVTFGFDINEQLLSGGARRARCDLLRDALPPRAAALRYVPPRAPPDTAHLHQIVDYVGSAWEDVVRCCSGKVRYFSE